MKLEFLKTVAGKYNIIKEKYPDKATKIVYLLKKILAQPENGKEVSIQIKDKEVIAYTQGEAENISVLYTYDTETVTIIRINPKNSQQIKLEKYSDDEYASVMSLMSKNRGNDTEPKVGIFWYNRTKRELFGVISQRISNYTEANASDSRITCAELHEDIWKREFNKQKYHNNGKGPYIGAYQDKPRGRIFYNIKTKGYEVAVGKWIEEYPEAYQLILEEFNLPKDNTTIKYAIHWDIGMSWR